MRPSKLLVGLLPILLLTTSCVSGSRVRQRTEVVRGTAEKARKSGAYRCAPKQLALADFHLDAAQIELKEGMSNKALRHVKAAEQNAVEALARSGDCAPKTVVIKQPKTVKVVDQDGDGILDDVDRCPLDPEDFDGFEDDDGCPDPDNDGDGILDAQDACPMEPGPPETKGCPDQDQDGIANAEDQCPLEAGPRDSNAGVGCPPKYKLVVKTKDKIEIRQKILFATGKATILGRSHELLTEVAQVLKDYPAIKVRIEGHTDSVGSNALNQRLSEARAASVREFLEREGIDATRLTSQGFGEERPIESNATAQGRESNRRVEFFITEQ